MDRERAARLKLPTTVVGRIVKQALPENAKIGSDARSVVSRAASVFILNLASFATDHAQGKKRRMVTGEDVMAALKSLECERLEDKMTHMMDAWKAKKAEKTAEAAKKRADKKAAAMEAAKNGGPVVADDCEENDLPDTVPLQSPDSVSLSNVAEDYMDSTKHS